LEKGKSRLGASPEEVDLDYVFSLHYKRKTKKDGTISFIERRWKIGKFPGVSFWWLRNSDSMRG